jgi:hypothetical protein
MDPNPIGYAETAIAGKINSNFETREVFRETHRREALRNM